MVFSMSNRCINVMAKPGVIEMYTNLLLLIPVNVKIALLNILCKRGFIKDAFILKQLVNSKVTEMDLSECDVTDNMLSCLFNCKFLQKLDLSLRRRQTRCITKEVLSSLFFNLPHLKILAVPDCKEVNDKVITAVSENCKQLKELYIPNSAITDLSLYFIGQNLINLCVLNILGTQISDTGIEYLANGPLSKSLSEINIDKCPKISSYSSIMIAENCTNLKIFTCGLCVNDENLVSAINEIRSKSKQVFWRV